MQAIRKHQKRENYIKRSFKICIVYQMSLQNGGGLKGRIVGGIRRVNNNVGKPEVARQWRG
jgi:hypothetical protein